MTDYKRLTPEELDNLKAVVNEDKNPVQYLGIDPGKGNGVCGYDAKFYLQFMYTVHSEDMVMFLQQFEKVQKCILEDYRLFPNKIKEQIYSDMETSRVIGRVESWVKLHKVELIMQSPSIKPTGYSWIGEKPPSKTNPLRHQMDAHVHFMYWAVRNGKIKSETLLKRSIKSERT